MLFTVKSNCQHILVLLKIFCVFSMLADCLFVLIVSICTAQKAVNFVEYLYIITYLYPHYFSWYYTISASRQWLIIFCYFCKIGIHNKYLVVQRGYAPEWRGTMVKRNMGHENKVGTRKGNPNHTPRQRTSLWIHQASLRV